MSTVMRSSARATSVVAALLLVILGFGGAGAAYATPGNGHGNNAAKTAGAKSAHSSAGRSATLKASASKKSSAKTSSNNGKSSKDHATAGNSGTSGDVTQPQPISGADDNTGGANGQCTPGVYCSTRDGSPSLNGNGTGKATGKPCAGCVGKADNKNPQGQKPNADADGNNGYECDGNNGIAKTNPAHTGCAPAAPCVESPTNPCEQPCDEATENCGGEECPPGAIQDGDDCIAGEEELLCPDGSVMPASGVCSTDGEKPPTVLGTEAFRPRPNAQVLGAQVLGAQAGVLPATGSSSELALLAGAGFTMLALGAAVLLRRRVV